MSITNTKDAEALGADQVTAFVEEAKAYAAAHLPELCQGFLAWNERGEAPTPAMEELKRLCVRFVGGAHAMAAAENEVTRQALRQVALSR